MCLWILHINFNLAWHPQLTECVAKFFAFQLLATEQKTYAAFALNTARLRDPPGKECRKWLQWAFWVAWFNWGRHQRYINEAMVVCFLISIFFIEYARILVVEKGTLTAANLWCKKNTLCVNQVQHSLAGDCAYPNSCSRKTCQGMQICSADTNLCINDARTDARNKVCHNISV